MMSGSQQESMLGFEWLWELQTEQRNRVALQFLLQKNLSVCTYRTKRRGLPALHNLQLKRTRLHVRTKVHKT